MNLSRHRWRLGGVAAMAALVMTASACGGSSGPSSSGGGGGTAVKGGTVSWAELPSSPPNWIFPFMSLAYFSVSNSQDFQYQMYRPLYWFGGQNTQPTVDYSLSPASAPVYSNGGKTITISMKGWKWSNGETVSANDVLFWLHMMDAEFANWAGGSPGGIPHEHHLDVGQREHAHPAAQQGLLEPLVHLQRAVPDHADADGMGRDGGRGQGRQRRVHHRLRRDKWAKCKAVYNFLIAQAKNTGAYTTSPIWTVVDGPFKLQSFNTAGNVSFVPNTKYSGSPKPQIAVFKEVPFTSDTAEYTALKTGSINIGYIPTADLPVKSPTAVLPPSNPLGSNYTLAPNYDWGFAYYQINWNNPTMGPVFKQLYARQALEYVANQNGMAKATYRGYAYANTGAAPAQPTINPWLPTAQKENGGQGPYPFNTAKAASLLTAHGWKMVNGVMTCQTPAKCGAGIAAGTKFSFELDYSTGQAAFTAEAAIYKSDASKAGIAVNIVGKTFNAVISEAIPTNKAWQGAMYGLWIYSPDYEPTGEALFADQRGFELGRVLRPGDGQADQRDGDQQQHRRLPRLRQLRGAATALHLHAAQLRHPGREQQAARRRVQPAADGASRVLLLHEVT